MVSTIDDYLAYRAPADADDELIEGEIILSPSPMPEHADICARFYDLLTILLRGSAFVVRQDTSMRLSASESMLRPDVFVIDRARWKAAAAAKTYLVGSPQLVIEVFSPANDTPDFRRKPNIYIADGAAAVWVVHPESKLIEVYDRRGTRNFVLGEKVTLPEPLAAGSIRLDEVFEG